MAEKKMKKCLACNLTFAFELTYCPHCRKTLIPVPMDSVKKLGAVSDQLIKMGLLLIGLAICIYVLFVLIATLMSTI